MTTIAEYRVFRKDAVRHARSLRRAIIERKVGAWDEWCLHLMLRNLQRTMRHRRRKAGI